MKHASKLLLIAILITSGSNVLAATSADLIVNGKIMPTSCTPTFTGAGKVDYGDIPTKSLSPSGETVLPAKEVGYSINCTAPMKIMIAMTDNRKGTESSQSTTNPGARFGLGLSGSDPIGYYIIQNNSTIPTTGDGVPIATIATQDDGHTWIPSISGSRFATKNKYSYAAKSTTIPKAFKTFAGSFVLTTHIESTSDFDVSNTVPLNGLATFELTYI